jgi:hypothetical protein
MYSPSDRGCSERGVLGLVGLWTKLVKRHGSLRDGVGQLRCGSWLFSHTDDKDSNEDHVECVGEANTHLVALQGHQMETRQ